MVSHGSRVLLRGASVYSPTAPAATAMFVSDGVVRWVGEDAAASAYADSADTVVDLGGRLVTPGFVDAHVHLAQTGLALTSVDLGSATSLSDALDRLARYASTYSGAVLYAQGWDETRWPERRPPTRHEIDGAVGDRPAYIARVDAHSAVVSSALLALQPDLPSESGWSHDGRVERDAHHAVRDLTHSLWTSGDRRAAIGRALDHAASRGITSVHELNAPHIGPFSDLELAHALQDEAATIEVVPYWGALLAGSQPSGAVVGYAGDLNVDGAIGSRTAAMRDPYADADTRGHLYLDEVRVRDHVLDCTRLGVQGGFHVIGDRALAEVVGGLRQAADSVGVDAIVAARHRLEHVEMPDDDQIKTLADLGVVASVQPAFDAAWGAAGELYEQRLGFERAAPMNPFGRMHRAGVMLAFGSDSPVTPLDPWGGVRAACFHHTESERLTVQAAFDAHTRGGHRARRDDSAGVLTPGAAATYAVWEATAGSPPPTPTVLPDVHPDLDLPRCLLTVVRGHVIFDAEESS